MSPALFLKIYNVTEYIYKIDPNHWRRGLLRTLPFAWDHTHYHIVKQRVRDIVHNISLLEFFSELITLSDEYMHTRKDLRYPFRSALGHTLANKYKELLERQDIESNDGKLLGSTDILDRGIKEEYLAAQVYINDPSINEETSELSLLLYNDKLTCEERYILYNLVADKQIDEICDDLQLTRMSIFNKMQSVRSKCGTE